MFIVELDRKLIMENQPSALRSFCLLSPPSSSNGLPGSRQSIKAIKKYAVQCSFQSKLFFFLFTVDNCSFLLLVAFSGSDFPALMSWQFSFLGREETIQELCKQRDK